MRLADFILANIEPILAEWEVFARSILAGAKMDKLSLRDHAEDILRATVRDMTASQSATERFDKSTGHGVFGIDSTRLDAASEIHGVSRVGSGFDLGELVSEYRALRASVIMLWRDSSPKPHLTDLDDLTRFNESIDQSLRKAVVSYARRLDQSRKMFLAILAHDLRNPLTSIMMSANLVSLTGADDPDTADAALQIRSSAAAIANMVTDLLDFAGTGVGAAMPLSPAPMDLVKLCQEVYEEFRVTHPQCTLQFEPGDNLTGTWDASRLRQVLTNLLGNAAQHGGANCNVRFSVKVEGAFITLAIHNGGDSIAPDLLATIFEPLVRGGPGGAKPHRRAGSIGLGLYIAREIAIAHGGTIDVTSSKETGTTFTVHLPLNAPSA